MIIPSYIYELENDLLSYWDMNSIFNVPQPTNYSNETFQSIFPDFKQVDFVGYATNPGFQRNQTSNSKNYIIPHSPARKLDILLKVKILMYFLFI